MELFSPPDVIISSKGNNKVILIGGSEFNIMRLYHDLRFQLSFEEIKKYLQFRRQYMYACGDLDLKRYKNLVKIQDIVLSSSVPSLELDVKRYKRWFREDNLPPLNIKCTFRDILDVSNVRIPKVVEKVYYDTDLKAVEGMKYLYDKGYNVDRLARFLSVGALGKNILRKIVPTKYSITAVDSNLGDIMLNEIKSFDILENFLVFYGVHYGNFFLIVFLPSKWSFELIEVTGNKVGSDYELYYGRKKYPSNTGGGYYAVRFAILEYLRKIRRQASIIVIRDIKPSYYMSLGVWVLRESVRNILSSNAEAFNGVKELKEYLKYMRKYYLLFCNSTILEHFLKQKRLW